MRDWNIEKSYRHEIDMRTKVTRNKKRYSRKIKHKKREFDMDFIKHSKNV
jgi:hypothetical protein